jgi:hypothetical protein
LEELINKQHYFDRKYLRRERLFSFIEQIELIKKFTAPEDNLLEIGVGNGFINLFVKNMLGMKYASVDINASLQPDIVDDISQPKVLKPKTYDVVCCFEVLEHLPIEQSRLAVTNMLEIARNYVLLSVPDMRYFIRLSTTVFGTLPLSLGKLISFPRIRRRENTFGADHVWEIGIRKSGIRYNPDYVSKMLFENKTLIRDYRCAEVPWHHFYVVKA